MPSHSSASGDDGVLPEPERLVSKSWAKKLGFAPVAPSELTNFIAEFSCCMDMFVSV